MLHITIPAGELYNEDTGEFLHTKEQKLTLEHSLVSLARWESKWHKPFLSPKPKTREESVDYVRCMTLTQNVDPLSYQFLTSPRPNRRSSAGRSLRRRSSITG